MLSCTCTFQSQFSFPSSPSTSFLLFYFHHHFVLPFYIRALLFIFYKIQTDYTGLPGERAEVLTVVFNSHNLRVHETKLSQKLHVDFLKNNAIYCIKYKYHCYLQINLDHFTKWSILKKNRTEKKTNSDFLQCDTAGN